MCLWEHSNFQGRRLVFRDEGRWQNLGVYNFEQKASSDWNRRGDDAAIARWNNGGSPKLCISQYSKSSHLGSWNDRVKSDYLARTSRNC